MLKADLTPLLADFGISKMAKAPETGSARGATPSHAVKGSAAHGTEGYLAPEARAPSLQFSASSDIYALGVIILQTITKR